MNIYGWGVNKFGSLGLVGGNVPDPKLVPIPDLADPKDFITTIECGKRFSSFLTKNGEVWMTGNYIADKL